MFELFMIDFLLLFRPSGPFRGVLSQIGHEVTRKVRFLRKETANYANFADKGRPGNRRKRRQRRSSAIMSDRNHLCFLRYHAHSCYPRNPWLDYLGATEAAIFSNRGSPRIESQTGSSL